MKKLPSSSPGQCFPVATASSAILSTTVSINRKFQTHPVPTTQNPSTFPFRQPQSRNERKRKEKKRYPPETKACIRSNSASLVSCNASHVLSPLPKHDTFLSALLSPSTPTARDNPNPKKSHKPSMYSEESFHISTYHQTNPKHTHKRKEMNKLAQITAIPSSIRTTHFPKAPETRTETAKYVVLYPIAQLGSALGTFPPFPPQSALVQACEKEPLKRPKENKMTAPLRN